MQAQGIKPVLDGHVVAWNRARLTLKVMAAACCLAAVGRADEPLRYNRDVRPILSQGCFACHGPDSASRRADLRLDRRDDAVASGAIVPGNVEESQLVVRLFSTDPEQVMPPPDSHKELTTDQRELLKRWVAQGAEYEAHWSLIPPTRPAPPAVQHENWIRTPLDRFVLAKLEASGLAPAPEADKRTLARRLSLDITGLPPAVEWVEQFVDDASPQAYENLIDRLMARQEWGEHRGRYWLDAARYADTHGIHFDNFREVWAYRDWVIKAFNRNLPFDVFTIEQLAGDLLPNATLDQKIASGFNRCNITTNEGGVIPEEYLVLYTRDRTETTAAVWMGLTANCCTCHDHKFDPLPQREFYEMAAFFNNTTQGAMDGNIKDTPPIVPVPLEADLPRWEQIVPEIAAVSAEREQRRQVARGDYDAWVAGADKQTVVNQIPHEDLLLHAALQEGAGNTLKVTINGQLREVKAEGISWEDGHVSSKACAARPGSITTTEAGDFDRTTKFTCSAWVKLSEADKSGAILARMNEDQDFRGWDLWLERGRVASHIVSKWPHNAIKVISKGKLAPNRWTHVALSYDGSAKAEGVKIYLDGALQQNDVAVNKLEDTTHTDVPLKIGQRNKTSELNGLALQDLRLYGRDLNNGEISQIAAVTRAFWLSTKPADQRGEAEANELFTWWLNQVDPVYQAAQSKLVTLEQEKAAISARGTIASVMTERVEAPEAYVLFRGDYDKRRDQVVAKTPSMLPALPEELPRNRLGFAQWLMRPEHPLTARVTVNRIWQELFGTGLVRTAGDFGVAGELPSNQELLDWMAVEFRESGWDLKRFYKLLMMSAAYRQAATVTPEKLEKDPLNRLVSRGPRFRMDAEMVRDYALASSGLLVQKVGGPSVKPYQPDGVWEAVAMIGSNTRDYRADSGDNLYRRSMYTFWKRSAPPASMDIFNAPSREMCTTRRERTNTPLQALTTLNDPQFVEAARRLAERVLQDGGTTTESRLDLLARRLLARPWRDEELSVIRRSLAELSAHYAAQPAAAAELIATGESKPAAGLDPVALAAWTMLANELMNLDEVLNK